MEYKPYIVYINEEHFAKGCYHYYDNYCKLQFTAYNQSRPEARRALRKVYPTLNNHIVKFVQR